MVGHGDVHPRLKAGATDVSSLRDAWWGTVTSTPA